MKRNWKKKVVARKERTREREEERHVAQDGESFIELEAVESRKRTERTKTYDDKKKNMR